MTFLADYSHPAIRFILGKAYHVTHDVDLNPEAMAEVEGLVDLLQIDNFLPAGLNFGRLEDNPDDDDDDRASNEDVSEGEDLIEVKNIKLEPIELEG